MQDQAARNSPSGAQTPHDRWFYIGMAIRAVIVISSGFAPTATGPIAGSTETECRKEINGV